MKNALRFLTLLTVVLFLFNCGGDDGPPAVVPTVDFSHERQIVEPGDEVAFTSTNTDAESFSWNFGDGNSSTEQNPTHTYTSTGTFTVTLTVTSSTGDTAESSSSVTVGDRYMTELVIVSIDFEDENGNPWDEDSGPDVVIAYGPLSEEIDPFIVANDMVPDNFPVRAVFEDEANQPLLTDENWIFILFENDEPFDTIDENTAVIGGYEFNPATWAPSEKNFVDGTGSIELTGSGADFVIEFVIRP